jgi:hypothetical protein
MSDDEGDDYDYDEKERYIPTFDQMGHVGPATQGAKELMAAAIRNDLGLDAAIRKAGVRMDPESRFAMLCEIYYDKFNSSVSDASIVNLDTLMNKANRLKWKRYTNPICFVAGAKIIGRDRKISKTILDTVFRTFSQTFSNEKIAKEDLIRYGRMWEQLLV